MSNTKICLGTMKFTFTDENDREFASFRLNPGDPAVAKRCEEVAAHFAEQKERHLDDLAAIVDYGAELEGQISYLLGYDAKEDLFSLVSPCTVLPDGTLFAVSALDAIADAIKPEVERRKQNMAAASAKYTAKYNR